MKNKSALNKIGPVLLVCLGMHIAGAMTLYVSPAGNDQSGTGSLQAPFQSILRTQSAVREKIAAAPGGA